MSLTRSRTRNAYIGVMNKMRRTTTNVQHIASYIICHNAT